jgi:hypothetical protein
VETLDEGREIERPRDGSEGRFSSGGVGWKLGMLAAVGVRISMPIGCWWTRVDAVVNLYWGEKRRGRVSLAAFLYELNVSTFRRKG